LNPTDKGMLWDHYFNVYFVAYVIEAFVLLFKWQKETPLKRHKKQAKIIFTTILCTSLFGTTIDILLPLFSITLFPPLTVFFIMFVMIGITYSMSKYGLMTITNEKILTDVFSIMKEGLFILDHNDTIVGVNEGATTMLEYREQELLYQNSRQFLGNFMQLSKNDLNYSQELILKTKSSKVISVLASASTLFDNCEQLLGTVVIFQNLTALKNIQIQLEEAYEDLELKVEKRTNELVDANRKLGNEIQKRIEKESQIQHIAYHDQLTNLPNRRYFRTQLQETLKSAKISQTTFAVLFLDLDGFKFVNDSLGHIQGDALLCKVAERLSITLRSSDILSRVGGDEFLLLLENMRSKDDISRVCEKMLESFNSPFILSQNSLYASTSIGISVFPDDGDTSSTLIKHADIAMYHAKESGKGKYAFFHETMSENLDRTLQLSSDLHTALSDKQLEVYYQPQVDTTTEQIIGVEALIRWNHPRYGLINPDFFIPIAEKNGLIVEIGKWALEQAIFDFQTWQSPTLHILAVNLSINQLLDQSLPLAIKTLLDTYNFPAQCLELEITESILPYDIDHIIKMLHALKEYNIRIAIDDFGTDYSSLSYLKQLPIDRIKIAKSFIDGIGKSQQDESIISAIILLSQELNLDSIAEGVETQQQLDYLRKHHCPAIQGFFYYKPMEKTKLEDHLTQLSLQEKRKSASTEENLPTLESLKIN
jgi:diguanylate cyclase (GGDEF)-like protein